MTKLHKKENFSWDFDAIATFEKLKSVLTKEPVPTIPDFSKPFVVKTNAPGTSIGQVFSSKNRLGSFFSKKLTPTLKKQSAYRQELYFITKAIAKFGQYLLGHKFLIRTN